MIWNKKSKIEQYGKIILNVNIIIPRFDIKYVKNIMSTNMSYTHKK